MVKMKNVAILILLFSASISSFGQGANTADTSEFYLGHHTDDPESVAISAMGNRMATGAWDNSIQIYNVDTSAHWQQQLDYHKSAVSSLSFDRKGNLLASGGQDYKVVLWKYNDSLKQFELDRELPNIHTAAVTKVIVGPYAKMVYSAGADGRIMMYSVTKKTKRIIDHKSPINDLAISTNRMSMYCADESPVLKHYDLTGQVIRELEGHEDVINSVAFSLNSKYILTGSSDKTAIVWDVAKGKIVHTLKGHDWKVTSVAISEDCKYAITGSNDGYIKIWNIETGELVRSINGHGNNVRSVSITANRTLLGVAMHLPQEAGEVHGGYLYRTGVPFPKPQKKRKVKKVPPKVETPTAGTIKNTSSNGTRVNSTVKNKPNAEKSVNKKVIRKTDEIEITEEDDE
jgi:WD40 repeat protein